MKLKFYLIGFGMGALLATAILIISGGLNKTSMTDDEIMARARQLGMVEANSRLIDQSTQGTSNAELSANSVTSQTVAGTGTSEDDQASAANDASQDASDASGAGETGEAADEGKSASEAAAEGNPAEDVDTNEDRTSPGTGIVGEDSTGTNTSQSAAAGSSKSETGRSTGTGTGAGTQSAQVIVTVPDGLYSEGVSELLQQAGAIDDATAFNAYLIQSGRDRYITPGAKLIPAAATYEEVAQILSGR